MIIASSPASISVRVTIVSDKMFDDVLRDARVASSLGPVEVGIRFPSNGVYQMNLGSEGPRVRRCIESSWIGVIKAELAI